MTKSNDISGARRTKDEHGAPRHDATLVWGVIAGLIAAWVYVAPVAFNAGTLEALHRGSPLVAMVGLTPYPQLYDDRVALYASAIITVVVVFVIALPLVIRRVLTRWTVVTLLIAAALGLIMVFVFVPCYPWAWLVLAGVLSIGSGAVAGDARALRSLAEPAGSLFEGATARAILALVALLQIFLIIPAATGGYVATVPPELRGKHLYLLLYMKDQTSPLHREIVEHVASTTEYVVVRFSEKVPHPRQGLGPTTLPVGEAPEAHSEPPVFWLPMLVRRDSIELVTPSLDPESIVAEVRSFLSRHSLTTQPMFRVERSGAGMRLWTEYPSTAPAADRGGAP